MGADQGFLITDPAFSGSDTLVTAAVLARAIGRLDPGPDLILCGIRTADSDTGQVGPQVAEELGVPHVAYVTEVEGGERYLTVARRVDRQKETLRVPLPALLTILQAPSRPRDVPLSSVEEAFRDKGIERWSAEALGFEPHEVGLAGSATWVRRIREPEGSRKGRLVQEGLNEAVQAIVQALREQYVID
jgi:electron transfer flavoprotein beta subunit